MLLWSFRRTARVSGFAIAAALALSTGAMAQAASCFGPQQQLSAAVVAQFAANPAQVLAQHPDGGAQLISIIRDLEATDPGVLQLILNLVATANPGQVDAIGTALGLAAKICVATDQAAAAEIQQAVAAQNNTALLTAMTAVLGDVPIGAADGGGGGAGGGGGGGGISGNGNTAGSSEFFEAFPVTSGRTGTFLFSVTGGSTVPVFGVAPTSTTSASVSPSR